MRRRAAAARLQAWRVRPALGAAAVLAAALLAGWHLVNVSVTEHYSRAWHSPSSAEAEARGILHARPVVPRRDFDVEGAPLHVEDAWVEQVTRIHYRWLLFPVRIPRPGYRLVVRTTPADAPRGRRCGDRLSAGTVRLVTDGAFFFAPIDPPFPDTLHLQVLRGDPGCGDA